MTTEIIISITTLKLAFRRSMYIASTFIFVDRILLDLLRISPGDKNSTNKLVLKLRYLQVIHLFLLIMAVVPSGLAQEFPTLDLTTPNVEDSSQLATQPADSSLPDSSVVTEIDTTKTDTVPTESGVLEGKVDYDAVDSLKFDLKSQKVYLFGQAHVKYLDISLEASYIEIDLQNNVLFAKGLPDSTGKLTGTPVFSDKGQQFTAEEMKYQFKTKKGIIKKVITQEGDGYLHGETVKKDSNNVLYIRNGKYTTCSNPEPHFHIQSNKLKVIKNDKIVTGPAYLTVENVPTPLAVPFGYFPNQDKQSSGILMPQYGQSPTLGFYLQNGGYYMGISDNLDISLQGDIYSRGSWALNGSTNYKTRYRYNGRMELGYSTFVTDTLRSRSSSRDLPDFLKTNNYKIRWLHRQDPKARPNSNFSADVNINSTNNFRNNLNVSAQDYLTNTFSSSVSYNTAFSGTPFNMTVSATHNQNTSDSIINFTLPNTAFNMNRIYPLKRKNKVGADRWYEKIGVTYSNNFRNQISAKQDVLFEEKTLETMRNGMQHASTINTNFKILKFFTLSPSVNLSERWYLEQIEKTWDTENQVIDVDTIGGFSRFGQVSTSTSLTTLLYGMYSFKKGKVKAIRHVMTPSVNFSYRPDYSKPVFGRDLGYFKEVQSDTNGNTQTYSIFEQGIYGGPSRNESGIVGFGLNNNVEMKVRSSKDTITGDKKIKIFESLSFNSSYNLAIDSLNWAPINIGARTTILNKFTLQGNAVLDPYAIDSNGTKFNSSEWSQNNNIGRLTSARLAISFNLNGGKKDKDKKEPRTSNLGSEQELEGINNRIDDYVDFNVPWSVRVSYNITYSKPQFTELITNSITLSGDVNLTPKWKIGYRGDYDFRAKEIGYATFDIYRDLHCWEMRVSIVPFGNRQSYTFDLNVKSPILQDLKLSRKRNWYDI